MKIIIIFCEILLTLSGTKTKSRQTCQSKEDCHEWRKCCNNTCVFRHGFCPGRCGEDSDCDERCVGKLCTCENSNCSHSLQGSRVADRFTALCSKSSDCNTVCQNGSCQWEHTAPKDNSNRETLSPALLAIVAISGLFIFGCLFYCCLNHMKSGRVAIKLRNARLRRERAAARLEEGKQDKVRAPNNSADPETTIKLPHSKFCKQDFGAAMKEQDSPNCSGILYTGLPVIHEEEEQEEGLEGIRET